MSRQLIKFNTVEQYAGVKQEKILLYRLICNTLCNSLNSKQMPLERGEFFDKGHIIR